MFAKNAIKVTTIATLLGAAASAIGHGLIVQPPSRNALCGVTEKPDNATTQACVDAFANDSNGGYQFMSVLTHATGRKGKRSNNVCGFDSETWQGNATPWDTATDWPTNPMSSGSNTFVWNISWGPHYDDTEEFVYYITKPNFVYQVGVPLSWDDFEETPFCDLKYSDSAPTANPLVVADKAAITFATTCNVPARSGRHVIYGEWGRNYYTYERFHGCVDVTFDGAVNPTPIPTPTPEPTPTTTPEPTPIVTPPPGSGTSCEHVVSNVWGSGFQGAIRIINTGSVPIYGWEVSWSYTDGSTLNSVWGANSNGSGPYTASNLGWNSTIEPGTTMEFGFTGNGGGIASAVTGDVCN